MNAKKAKKLRQLVKMAARDDQGAPLPADGYRELEKNRKYVMVEKISGDGKSTYKYKDKEQIASGTIKLDPRTVKGVYSGMKKQFNKIMAG
jgi:hypothetical protein